MEDETENAMEAMKEKSEAYRIAAECVQAIDAAGGVFTTDEGVAMVLKALMEYYD